MNMQIVQVMHVWVLVTCTWASIAPAVSVRQKNQTRPWYRCPVTDVWCRRQNKPVSRGRHSSQLSPDYTESQQLVSGWTWMRSLLWANNRDWCCNSRLACVTEAATDWDRLWHYEHYHPPMTGCGKGTEMTFSSLGSCKTGNSRKVKCDYRRYILLLRLILLKGVFCIFKAW